MRKLGQTLFKILCRLFWYPKRISSGSVLLSGTYPIRKLSGSGTDPTSHNWSWIWGWFLLRFKTDFPLISGTDSIYFFKHERKSSRNREQIPHEIWNWLHLAYGTVRSGIWDRFHGTNPPCNVKQIYHELKTDSTRKLIRSGFLQKYATDFIRYSRDSL